MSVGLSENYQSVHVYMWPVSMGNEDTKMVLRATQCVKKFMRNTRGIFMNRAISPRYFQAVFRRC